MARKQVYIGEAQKAFLMRRARELGVTEAELIRRAINQLRQGPARHPSDPQAWQDVLALLQKRAHLPRGHGGSRWRRDDAYTERLTLLLG